MFCKNTTFFVFCKGKAGKNLYIYDNEEGFIYDNTDNLDNFMGLSLDVSMKNRIFAETKQENAYDVVFYSIRGSAYCLSVGIPWLVTLKAGLRQRGGFYLRQHRQLGQLFANSTTEPLTTSICEAVLSEPPMYHYIGKGCTVFSDCTILIHYLVW